MGYFDKCAFCVNLKVIYKVRGLGGDFNKCAFCVNLKVIYQVRGLTR